MNPNAKELEKFIDNTAYLQLPLSLVDLVKEGELKPLDAYAYSLLLNRAKLSMQNNEYIDDKGVFIAYQREKLANDCDVSVNTLKGSLKRLENIGLLEIEFLGANKGNKYYPKSPKTYKVRKKAESDTRGVSKIDTLEGSKIDTKNDEGVKNCSLRGQKLIPKGSKIDTKEGSKIDPNKEISFLQRNNNKEINKKSVEFALDNTHANAPIFNDKELNEMYKTFNDETKEVVKEFIKRTDKKMNKRILDNLADLVYFKKEVGINHQDIIKAIKTFKGEITVSELSNELDHNNKPKESIQEVKQTNKTNVINFNNNKHNHNANKKIIREERLSEPLKESIKETNDIIEYKQQLSQEKFNNMTKEETLKYMQQLQQGMLSNNQEDLGRVLYNTEYAYQ